jgi:hypothetical protein
LAAKPQGLKVTKSQIKQTIDLEDIFDGKVKDDVKIDFVSRCVDRIIERTQDGIDRGQRRFKPYSKEYAERKGVGVNDVDLTLFGDMLGSIEARFLRGQKAELYIDGTKNNLKAYNHMTPKDDKNKLPQREFFGLTKAQMREIAYEIEDERDGDIYDQEAFS